MGSILSMLQTNGIFWQTGSFPCEDEYDGYLQLENGVGMLRLLETEVKETLEGLSGDDRKVTGRIATGKLAAPFIARYIKEIQKKYPNVQIPGHNIENRFFSVKRSQCPA